MRLFCWGMMLTMGLSSLLFPRTSGTSSSAPARLAIYYGYPSLINQSRGDVEKAAAVFAAYDVVVLGDGIEFPDRQTGRIPEGDPGEHQKTVDIIAASRLRNPKIQFFGYICLGEIPSKKPELVFLSPEEIEGRARLWKQMGAAGIFLDEAGYDYSVVTRRRQNTAVDIIHKLGLSAFMNAYFLDHLFSVDNNLPYTSAPNKNPEHLPPLLDHRDLFLMESFQVKNGAYESAATWQPRLNQALAYRRRYGTQIFSTTTAGAREPFDAEKYSYTWWTARLYDFDGFSWGEPNFAASDNSLPDHRCTMDAPMLSALPASTLPLSDSTRFWKRAGNSVVVVDTRDHAVHRVPVKVSAGSSEIEEMLRSRQTGAALITCGGTHE